MLPGVYAQRTGAIAEPYGLATASMWPGLAANPAYYVKILVLGEFNVHGLFGQAHGRMHIHRHIGSYHFAKMRICMESAQGLLALLNQLASTTYQGAMVCA